VVHGTVDPPCMVAPHGHELERNVLTEPTRKIGTRAEKDAVDNTAVYCGITDIYKVTLEKSDKAILFAVKRVCRLSSRPQRRVTIRHMTRSLAVQLNPVNLSSDMPSLPFSVQ
jgi:hypothetical protein